MDWEEQFDWDFVRVKEVKQFISDLLAERDKEWLSCLPEAKELPMDGSQAMSINFNLCRQEFLQNAEQQKLI